MGWMNSRQKVNKRRRLPHIINKNNTLKNKIFRISKILLGMVALFLLDLGKKIFDILKDLLLQLWKIIRYNPLAHKIMLASGTTAFCVGSIFLVFFAIFSPELPPQNLISSINSISENRNGFHTSKIILTNDDDWVKLTLFDDKEFEKGAGSNTQDSTKDFEYPVRPGETLSEIAHAYKIPYDFLAWYNKIDNANRIKMGTVLIIPSLENIALKEPEYRQQRARQQQRTVVARTARSIEITYSRRNHDTPPGTTLNFSIVNPPTGLRSYDWDFGDGKRSFRENPAHEYSTPRTYVVRLTAKDGAGMIYRSNPLYIDIPHPASIAEHSTVKFVTLSSLDEYFVVNGTITRVARYPNIEDVLDLSESDNFLTKARFKKSGFFGITVQKEGNREQYYSIFVSPIPTMHADFSTIDFNWYRTQHNTGTPSNCGPASAAMAISWGTGKYYPVSAVRQAIGWRGNGGTSFDELLKTIRDQGVDARIRPLRTVDDIRNVIDSGAIAIILFHTDGVRTTRNNPATDLFGKYYDESVGHYIVIKGYSLNGDYLVVYDPIPSDWGGNHFRYADEVSMIGRNRYFRTSELLRSLRRHEMIVAPGHQ